MEEVKDAPLSFSERTCARPHQFPPSTPHPSLSTEMRPTISLRTLSSDPFKTHVGDRSPMWKKIREALVVNP